MTRPMTYRTRLQERKDNLRVAKEQRKNFRTNYIGVPESYLLDQAASVVNHAFRDVCYLVGSATKGKTYRDVDVRLIMLDGKFDTLFGTESYSHNPFWVLLTTSISSWFQERTGLPVDFQIQRMTDANSRYGSNTGNIRHPLGLMGRTWGEGEDQAPWRKFKFGD